MLPGCGTEPIAVTVVPVSVTVAPATALVLTGGSQSFTATVASDSGAKGVNWSIAGCNGGPTVCGSLTSVTSTKATYVAPMPIVADTQLAITATSVAYPAKSSSATVGLAAIVVSVVPASAGSIVNGSRVFTATVVNDPNNRGVAWSIGGCTGGSAACGGLTNVTPTTATYAAPVAAPSGALAVIATSLTDNTKSFTASVIVFARLDRIAFTSDRDGCPNLYAMNADGSGVAELTNIGYCGESANGTTWSPDGMKIAYDVTPNIWWVGRAPWLVVMNSDGSQPTTLIRDTLVGREEPAWSPDGTRIAGTNWGLACSPRGGCGPSPGSPQIFVVNVDGSNFKILASHGHTPAWSPDGTMIAFADHYNPDHTVNLIDDDIYVMNVDGTGVTNLTNSSGSDDSPAWSPDGAKIAFRSNRSGHFDLYVMNADGTGVTALTADTASEGRPAWSPDGKRIAFASDKDGDAEIYVMSADGSGVVKLTDNASWDARPAWAP